MHTTTRCSAPGAAACIGLAIATACAPAAPETPTPERAPAFTEAVDSVVSTPPVDRTHWGIEVYDPTTDSVLYARNAHLHFVPASNTKLTVTAVALAELGADWRYRTPLYAILGLEADSVAESLVLIGRGDPTLSERFHDTDFAFADSLADSVVVAGIRRADTVVVDASYFEDVLYHSEWNVGNRGWYWAAPVAGAGVAEGAVPYILEPGSARGEPARVTTLGPVQAVVIVDSILTDTAGARRDLDYERGFDSDTVRITGTVPLDADVDTSWVAVQDPARYLGLGLREALARRDVETGTLRVVMDSTAAGELLPVAPDQDCGTAPCTTIERCRVEPYEGAEPADTVCVTLPDPGASDVWPDTVPLPGGRRAVRVATWASAPMSEIVAGILKPSQNWMAETLLKTLGARLEGEGSWQAGVRAEYRYLFEEAGIDSAAVYLRDGSGLTAYNLLTPHAVTALLAHAMRRPWGRVYRQALATPAEEGTLEERLEALEGRVAAKTGTIRHVNALSGYLIADDGRTLIFSVLTNGSGIGSSDVRAAIDRIVLAMTSIGSRP